MSYSILVNRMKNSYVVLVVALALGLVAPLAAQATDKVTTYKDENGWKLQVNGSDFYVKGMVWGYTPRNENYTYNLWGESDDFVRKVLDYDFGLMKAAGVNAIRSFATIPPKWVTYIYREHGIMTVINPLMGRYGYTVGGKWVPFIDYSDTLTRATLIKDTLDIFEKYKNVPGVLMFALGNESNYGLSWSSFEIENLPEGERYEAKARYLYSLFNEVMEAGKRMDPNHPFSIVNGDLQYIDLIAELCPSLDVLGSNVYRGEGFSNLWEEVDKKLDLPVVFYEFGSDAFNAREFKEDQVSQAYYLKHQWQEMYNKAYGNGEEGNSIGGFVFEWRDEWWKYLQVERLDIHDTNASWANGGYRNDFVEGKNNMNEEWWGITALGRPNADGVFEARPRMAYDVLTQIWAMDPYTYKKSAFNDAINALDMEKYELKSEVRLLRSRQDEDDSILRFTGGSVKAEYVLKGTERLLDERGENGVQFSDGQMAFLDFAFTPTQKIDGQFTINVLGNVADLEPLEIQYGRRGLPVTVDSRQDIFGGTDIETDLTLEDRERIEIYDFGATYEGEMFDFEAFYHTPRYHWGYEGDFFGLIHEATDLAGMDIWNSKAPEGIELTGKGRFDGLTLLAGPEVYWGANPKAVLRYSSSIGDLIPGIAGTRIGNTEYTFIHSEDVARRDEGTGATGATERQTRQTTLYTKTQITSDIALELGGIMASTEKVDDRYDRVERGATLLDEIDFQDTLGLKTKLTFPLFGSLAYVATHHAGLVADAGNPLREFNTRLPYSSLGNKHEYEAGALFALGNLWIYPRVFYRDNLVHALPNRSSSIAGGMLDPGLIPRNRDDDPFAVLGNREARAAELFITYDPTGATPFYQWDNDFREDAGFAFNIGANYTEYPTATDSHLFFLSEANTNAAFGRGLPPEDVWEISSRMVFNPSARMRVITNLTRGLLQSTGEPDGGSRKFWDASAKFVLNRKHVLSGYYKKDAFGPYDFHRQFNITFPEQLKLDYSILLDQQRSEQYSNRIGVRTLYRSVDENSPGDEFEMGANDYLWQTVFYFVYNFGGTGTNVLPRN